ncbi:PREDICTED: uncharacterized protein LOC109175872 [Ipomoea nil]|uniref:uncharacterized protein LOC109175872 n=1 Tax=Ipomoea nil TaxID=35883 RepID=UPI000901E03A|nr:PREDICTED: uncharacterized protein LOC109175872 [Ipomoea nil]
MAAIWSQGYKVEAVEMNDTSKSAIRGETTTVFDDYSSDEEFSGLRLSSQEVGELVELCDFALSLLETQHPGECWKFKSMREAYREELTFCCTDDYYHLEFVGEKADGKSIRNFVVDVICSWNKGHERLTVKHCVLRKDDDEVEPMDEYMKKCVNVNIVKFCKSALTYYEELHSGEAYEFVKMQTMRCCVVGVIFVFHAKNKADDTVATFKAYNHYNVLRTDIDVVGSFR